MFIIRSKHNPALILTTTGEFKPQSMVGPGGYCAQSYKTQSGAQQRAARRGDIVERI